MSEDTLLDMDALLNQTLDNVEDVPDFVTPPPGDYALLCKDSSLEQFTNKEGKTYPRIRVLYEIQQTLAVGGNDVPVAEGSLFSETFMFTEKGLPFFKKRVKDVMNSDNVEGVSIKDMLDGLKGQTFKARITIKKSPNPNGGEYENVQIRVIPNA